MIFADLKSRSDKLRLSLNGVTGRDLVVAVSVEEPGLPQDELHFLKLVSWCYVFLFEASQPAARYLLSVVRAVNPSDHKLVTATTEVIKNLRTVRVHNLLPENKGDQHKVSQAEIWLLQNGGRPIDWRSCCEALCTEADVAIERLENTWRNMVEHEEDKETSIKELLNAIDQEWPAHFFDRILEQAADGIGLKGLDIVKYRQANLEKWRNLTSFFDTREHAQVAIEAAIRRELKGVFGNG
jgi:hypothetical protein